jgi:hypothetical protein
MSAGVGGWGVSSFGLGARRRRFAVGEYPGLPHLNWPTVFEPPKPTGSPFRNRFLVSPLVRREVDYGARWNERPTVLCRFRSPLPGMSGIKEVDLDVGGHGKSLVIDHLSSAASPAARLPACIAELQ